MEEDPTTSGLDPDRLKELLSICSEASQANSEMGTDQEKTELLQDLLAQKLPSELPEKGPLSDELTHLCHMSGLSAGESIKTILNNPQADITLIRKVKDCAKELSQQAASEAERDTANTIYYAAIASALVLHNIRITKFSYKDLENAFSVFTKTVWVSSDLSGLFERACEYCQGKIKNKD